MSIHDTESEQELQPEAVLDIIRRRGQRGMTTAQLVAHLLWQENSPFEGRSEVRERLRPRLKQLEREGQVVLGRGKRYFAAEHSTQLTGTVRMTGAGFAILDTRTPLAQPVRIPTGALRGALPGDRVLVRLEHPRRRARAEGHAEAVVVKVLERNRRQVVGRWRGRAGRPRVEPIDRKVPFPISVTGSLDQEPEEGELVLVSLDAVSERKATASGEVLERLGRLGEPGVDERVVIRHFELPEEFPPEALEEAEDAPAGITEADLAGRWDLRDRPAVTIDPETARDFDDAVNAMPGRHDAVVVEVHIADVGHYVREGTSLDAAARERGTSVYLPGRCLHMLPERISSELCCLRPQEDRLAMTVRFAVTPEGSVERVELGESVIRSRRRCVYGEVFGWLEAPSGRWPADTEEIAPSLKLLAVAAERLGRARRQRGSLDFDLQEPEVLLDPTGRVLSIEPATRNRAHRLIEELMVAANRCVAAHLVRNGQPALHRVHDAPDPVRVEQLKVVVAELGLRLDGEANDLAPASLQRLLATVSGRPEERLVATLVLRSLARAVYSPEPRGHYALALEEYLHFTSPIRRYPDLVVHRLLRRLLREGEPLADEERGRVEADLLRLAESCSAAEQRADAAERMAVLLKTLVYLQDRCGELFSGVVSGVTPFGVFVQLADVLVDGLVHVSELTDDYYVFEEHRQRLVGEHTGRSLRLGDPVEVLLVRVNLETMQLELAMAPGKGPNGRRRRAGRNGKPRTVRRGAGRRGAARE